ncbi:hypothetical protein RhiirC2_855705 [Rhizophagus irregularis]|uniref:Uncharacterized protein n=1 Tax=Rhizophagus irregularis TaxID=588596 RepID=A0A2N1MLA5_9GLOM|nr:hypothetical protein RhiirC2_855705 [Rhizophagus irregularis]
MEGSSSQSGNSSTNTVPGNLENNDFASYKTILHENLFNNRILLKLEEDGFTTTDDKVEELLKHLTKSSYLYTIKLLFENLQYEFSSQVLENSLEALLKFHIRKHDEDYSTHDEKISCHMVKNIIKYDEKYDQHDEKSSCQHDEKLS